MLIQRAKKHTTHDNFHCNEITGCGFCLFPMENALVRDVDTRVFALEFCFLQLDKAFADLDDIVPRSLIDVRILRLQHVENIQGKCTVSGTNFVDDKILVGKVLQQVLGNQASTNSASIPRLNSIRKSRKSSVC